MIEGGMTPVEISSPTTATLLVCGQGECGLVKSLTVVNDTGNPAEVTLLLYDTEAASTENAFPPVPDIGDGTKLDLLAMCFGQFTGLPPRDPRLFIGELQQLRVVADEDVTVIIEWERYQSTALALGYSGLTGTTDTDVLTAADGEVIEIDKLWFINATESDADVTVDVYDAGLAATLGLFSTLSGLGGDTEWHDALTPLAEDYEVPPPRPGITLTGGQSLRVTSSQDAQVWFTYTKAGG